MKFGLLIAGIVFITHSCLMTAPAIAYEAGEEAFLCLEDQLHPGWPEKFAFKVKILGLNERGRFKVEIVESYPVSGRVNEENLPVNGDHASVSRKMLFTKKQAGVQPGTRFDGKPVCANRMK